jgi:hypothetical protein
MNSAKVIALPKGLEHADTGTITYWRLAGGAVAYAPLRDAWVAAGLDVSLLPALPETHDAHGLPRHTVHRELVVTVAPQNNQQVELRGFTDAEVLEVRELYQTIRRQLSTQDVGGWLVDLVQDIHAVSLRDTGGIYYLPARESVAWQRYCDVLHSVTECRAFAIPALDGDGAVEAVLDALQRESCTVLAQASDQLHDVDADGKRTVGKRALKTRATRLEVLEKKIEAYSGLLGARLNDLHARASDVAAKVGELLLTLEDA